MMDMIQPTTQLDYSKSVYVYYGPFHLPERTTAEEDRELLQLYREFTVEGEENCSSPWIMRIEIDDTELGSRMDMAGEVSSTHLTLPTILRV